MPETKEAKRLRRLKEFSTERLKEILAYHKEHVAVIEAVLKKRGASA